MLQVECCTVGGHNVRLPAFVTTICASVLLPSSCRLLIYGS